MPSIFLSLRKSKSRTKPHTSDKLKRNPRSSNISSNSNSAYPQASGGPGKTDLKALLSAVDLYEKRPGSSGDDVPSTLAPVSKTPWNPSEDQIIRALTEEPPTRLTRKASKVSFSDMRFGGTSMLGGYGRKSQRHNADDKDRVEQLSDMRSQIPTADVGEGAKGDKEIGAALAPTHGIMKTATNASAGAGTHSVRFTLDLPPKLDLDLSLSDEKVEDGSLDKKEESNTTEEPSRWGRQTTEAVLDRSKIVSTEFVSCEDDGGKKGDESEEGESSTEKRGSESVAPSAFETHLHQQQSTERDYSETSTISTLECESAFTVFRLEDLARVEPTRSDERALPRVPTMGHVSSGQESLTIDAKRQGRVFSRNGNLDWDRTIEEIARIPASSVNSRMTRRESLRKANQSHGCVSA